MFSCRVNDEVDLVLPRQWDAERLHAMVSDSRQYLRPWLGWVDGQTVEGVRQFLGHTNSQFFQGLGFYAAIRQQHDAWVGVIGLSIDEPNQSGSLGYWLVEGMQGRGLMTQTAQMVCHLAFTEYGLNRLEIRVAEGNIKSRAVASRLGFCQEGTLRQAQWVNGQCLNVVCYGLLRAEWQGRAKAGR